MKVVPIKISAAKEFVLRWHRHNKPPVGACWATGAEHDGDLIGVAMIGRPVARMADDGKTVEVTRVCVSPSAPKGANSFLYSAAKRQAQAMGYQRILTYTLETESGASMRGAGWKQTGEVKAAEWTRPSRERGTQEVYKSNKLRWEGI